jgi:hypothetical protein
MPTDVTTTISIRSDARHFTLTLSSPPRANMKQTLNIEVFSSAASAACCAAAAPAAAFGPQGRCHASPPSAGDAMQTDDQDDIAASAGPSSSSWSTAGCLLSRGSKKTPRAKHGLFK